VLKVSPLEVGQLAAQERAFLLSLEALVKEALEKGVNGIAWTFNEPIVWAEYVIDASRLARAQGLYTMVNTNGFVEGRAREELLDATDVIKVDVKGFTKNRYAEVCGGFPEPVLETCLKAKEKGVHLELAYLMIPDTTDSLTEIAVFFSWVTERLGPDTPLHLFRFFPSFCFSRSFRLRVISPP
jgi:pyruvate formate lyase activating enzyme